MRAVAVAGPLGGEQQQVEALGADALLEAAEDLVEERVLEVGVALAGLHEHADHVRALGDQAARRRGGRVIELLREPHDPFAGLRAHVGIAVERA